MMDGALNAAATTQAEKEQAAMENSHLEDNHDHGHSNDEIDTVDVPEAQEIEA